MTASPASAARACRTVGPEAGGAVLGRSAGDRPPGSSSTGESAARGRFEQLRRAAVGRPRRRAPPGHRRTRAPPSPCDAVVVGARAASSAPPAAASGAPPMADPVCSNDACWSSPSARRPRTGTKRASSGDGRGRAEDPQRGRRRAPARAEDRRGGEVGRALGRRRLGEGLQRRGDAGLARHGIGGRYLARARRGPAGAPRPGPGATGRPRCGPPPRASWRRRGGRRRARRGRGRSSFGSGFVALGRTSGVGGLVPGIEQLRQLRATAGDARADGARAGCRGSRRSRRSRSRTGRGARRGPGTPRRPGRGRHRWPSGRGAPRCRSPCAGPGPGGRRDRCRRGDRRPGAACAAGARPGRRWSPPDRPRWRRPTARRTAGCPWRWR